MFPGIIEIFRKEAIIVIIIIISLPYSLLKLDRAAKRKQQPKAVSDDKGKPWIAAFIKTHSSLKSTKQKTETILNSEQTNQQYNSTMST